jgi:NYN domain
MHPPICAYADRPCINPLIRLYSGHNPPAACRRLKGRFGRKSGRPSAYLDILVARTIVYIDGFNLYYRALKGTPHKWLDIEAMSRAALPHTCTIERVNYYTAHISGRVDPNAPRRQHAYLRAISTLPKVVVHYGNFLISQKWAGLVQPPDFRPSTALPPGAAPQVAYVWKTEEKGSDVNLGVHLVRDAFKGAFDFAAVLTNDTDLVEPIRIVTEELGLPVTLLTPIATPSTSLARVASAIRHIRPYIGPCQLPDVIPLAGKNPIRKPIEWT